MKKTRILLLALPLILGVFYLRSLTSWRPQKIYAQKGAVRHLVFSGDGKTLLVVNAQRASQFLMGEDVVVTALQTQAGNAPLWRHEMNALERRPPQFFNSGGAPQIFQEGRYPQALSAVTGKMRTSYNPNYFDEMPSYLSSYSWCYSAMSPTGTWLAYHASVPRTKNTFMGRLCLIPADNTSPIPQNAIPSKKIVPQTGTSDAFAFSPDGNTFVVGVGDLSGAHLDFYDVNTWKRTRVWRDFQQKSSLHSLLPCYSYIKWSRNGQFLLSSWTAPRGTYFKVWRTRDGVPLTSFFQPIAQNTSPAPEVQNDGRVLRFEGNGALSLGKLLVPRSDGKQIFYAPTESITAATMSPDGSCLMVGTSSGRVYRQRLK